MNTPLTVPTIKIRSPLCGVIASARSINCVLSVLTSGPPSHYGKGLGVRFLSDSRQVLRERIERRAPSTLMRVPSRDRLEDRVMQRKLGLAANILKQQRHRRLGPGRI